MADPAANLSFLPSVREGAATAIPALDTLLPQRGVAELSASLSINNAPGVSLSIRLRGPADVTGLDARQIVRMEPLPDSGDFEPNFLVFVEFDRPDFPWLFTPAKASEQDHLRPWLVLVVVAEGEGVSLGPRPGAPLPALTLTPAARPSRQLPDLDESWAWAHGQAIVAGQETLDDVIAGRPERTASRLVCPRRLDPETRYLACVVPAFMAGRRAGLGLPPDDADAELRRAWEPRADAETVLPVYFSWSFATGTGGDFESLARALKARPIPAEVGTHEVYVGAAGSPLPALPPGAAGAVVALRGALVPPEVPAPPWPPATRAQVQQGLRRLLDLSAQRLGTGGPPPTGPPVTPPLYARWLAAQPTVPTPAAGPAWLRTLNLDPRHRAVAGLATRIVQAEQERLMDQAWAQVGEIEQANRE